MGRNQWIGRIAGADAIDARQVSRTPRRAFFKMSQTLGTPAMNVGRNSWIAPRGRAPSGFWLMSRPVARGPLPCL